MGNKKFQTTNQEINLLGRKRPNWKVWKIEWIPMKIWRIFSVLRWGSLSFGGTSFSGSPGVIGGLKISREIELVFGVSAGFHAFHGVDHWLIPSKSRKIVIHIQMIYPLNKAMFHGTHGYVNV